MTGVPYSWTWRQGPVDPGPCVVVDIDGVLADATHRQYLLNGPRRWDDFFEAAGEDDLIDEVATLLPLLRVDLARVLLTARPDWIRRLTVAWLERHGVEWDLLIMRDDGDYSPSPMVKQREVQALRAHGFDPRLALDDDPRNVVMFRRMGIPTLEIPSGYHGIHGGDRSY